MDIKRKIKLGIGIAVIGAVLLLCYEVFYWLTHVYESNARVQTDFTNISAQVDGKVDEIHVVEGTPVRKGQLLITLFHDDIKLNIASLQTDLALEQANRVSLISEQEAFEESLRSKLATQLEKIRALETEHQSVQERLLLARKDLTRVNVLVGKKLTPEAKLTIEQDKALVLEGQASSLKGNIAIARRELDELKATERQLEVLKNKIKMSYINENKIMDQINKENLYLSYRKITSPIDGVVGKIHRFKGEYFEDATNILTLHDPKLYWVEAYVDESQIRHVRIGQAVLVDLDAYPFRDFYGTVRQIGNVTTNGIVNGVNGGGKLGSSAERVPVRISLDNPPPNLTPGMRADVNIRIYENIRLWRISED